MEGDLTITVENARGLKDCDWFKRQDPYVEITCAGARKRTSTHRNGGTCPHWNEKLTFKLHHETHLVARILDEDRHLLGKVRGDDEVGAATLDLVMARQKHGKRMVVPVYRKGKQRGTLSFLIDFRPSSSSSRNGPLLDAATVVASHSSGCCFCNGSGNAGSTQDSSRHGSICSTSHISSCSSSSRGINQQEHIIASTGQGPLVYDKPWTGHSSSSTRSNRHYTHPNSAERHLDQDQRDVLSWVETQPQLNHCPRSSSICSSTRQSLHSETTTADQQDGVSNAGQSDVYSGWSDSCDLADRSHAGAVAADSYPTLGHGSSGPTLEVPVDWGELPSLQAMLDLLGTTDPDHLPVQGLDHHSSSKAAADPDLLPVQGSDHHKGCGARSICSPLGTDPDDFPVQGFDHNSTGSSSGGGQNTCSSTSSGSSSCASPSRVGSQHDSSSSTITSNTDAGYLSYLIAQGSVDLLLQPAAAAAAVVPHSNCDTPAAQQQQQEREDNSSKAVLQEPGPVDTAAEPAEAAATAISVDDNATAADATSQVPVTAAKQVAAAGGDGTGCHNTSLPAEPLAGHPAPDSAEGMLQPEPGMLQPPTPAPVPAAVKLPAAAATAAGKQQSSPPPRGPPAPPPPPPPPLGPLKMVGPRPPPPPKGGSSNLAFNANGVQRFGDVVAMWQQMQREKNGLGRAKTAVQSQGKGGGGGGHAEVIDAIKQNSKYHAAVLADFEARAADITKWANEVRSFQATTMPKLVAFVDSMELQLNTLKDEQQELKMFGDWPEKRYDTFRDATAQLRYLEKLRSQIDSWSPAACSSCQAILGELQKRLYDLSCKMLTYSTGEDMMEKRFKSEDVPWPGKSLSDSVRVASLKYGRAYLTATTQEVQRLKSLQPPPRDLQQKQKQLLEGAVAYTYRLHSFVSGLDAETYALFKVVVELLIQLKAEQQQQEAMDSKQQKMSTGDVGRPKDQGAADGGAAVALAVRAS